MKYIIQALAILGAAAAAAKDPQEHHRHLKDHSKPRRVRHTNSKGKGHEAPSAISDTMAVLDVDEALERMLQDTDLDSFMSMPAGNGTDGSIEKIKDKQVKEKHPKVKKEHLENIKGEVEDSAAAKNVDYPTAEVEIPIFLLQHLGFVAPPLLTCEAGFVECDNGFEVIGGVPTATTCQDACNALKADGAEGCCDDDNNDACERFTGKVCADGSCSGASDACDDANIRMIIHGCIGDEACEGAGSNGGFIGEVNNGCIGEVACWEAAQNGGYINSIVNSCIGRNEVCYDMAEDGGEVGDVINSCWGDYACEYTADDGGKAGNIVDSCWGYDACYEMALDGGVVGDVTRSCRGDYACEYTADDGEAGNIVDSCWGYDACEYMADGGVVGDITRSCRGYEACYDLGYSGGTVGDVEDSCVGYYSCESLGNDEGIVGDITSSCCGVKACDSLADDDGEVVGDIFNACNAESACEEVELAPDDILSCCNTPNECEDVDGVTVFLPDKCGTSSPTTAPTPSPTSAPMDPWAPAPNTGLSSKASKSVQSAKADGGWYVNPGSSKSAKSDAEWGGWSDGSAKSAKTDWAATGRSAKSAKSTWSSGGDPVLSGLLIDLVEGVLDTVDTEDLIAALEDIAATLKTENV